MLTVGIDPGAKTGIAVIDSEGRLTTCRTLAHHDAEKWLHDFLLEQSPATVLVAVEIPGQSIYPRKGVNPRAMLKIARNVGQVQQMAEGIAWLAEQHGANVRRVHPQKGGTKKAIPATVWRAMFPEWTSRNPSNHARDAALIARRAHMEGR